MTVVLPFVPVTPTTGRRREGSPYTAAAAPGQCGPGVGHNDPTRTLDIVFDDDRCGGAETPLVEENADLPSRLLGIGLPLTIAFGTMMAAVLFTDLSFWEAAIIRAIVAPTDAAPGTSVTANQGVPERIRQALDVQCAAACLMLLLKRPTNV